MIKIENIQMDEDYYSLLIENQLNPDGLLILGKTETLFNSYNTLKLIDSRNHIYLKINKRRIF
ncbi:MAG: hypothetical protein ACFFFT_02890 [Candidatus Thorarchaeota archaeon]